MPLPPDLPAAAAPPDRTSAPRFLAVLLRELRWRFAGIALLSFVVSLAGGVGVVALVPMLQVVGLEVQGGGLERIAAAVVAGFAWVGLEPTLLGVLLLNAGVVTATAALSRWQTVRAAALTQSFVNALRKRLYRAISRADWLFLTGERSTHFTHALTGETERAGGALSALLTLLVHAGRTLVYVAVAFVVSPVATTLAIGCGLLLSLLLLRKTRLGRGLGEAVSGAYQGLYGSIGEHLAGMKVAKSHGVEERQVETFARAADRTADAYLDVVRNQADLGFWLQAGTVLVLSAVVWTTLEWLALPVATLLLLLYLFARLLPMVTGVQRTYQTLINLLPGYDRAVETLARCEAAAETTADEGRTYGLERALEMRGVRFGYDRDIPGGAGDGVVRDLDLVLPAGTTTAIVGPSGAGKSTIADLAVGLIAPDRGRILIDGEPLTRERARAWRGQIGYVSQDVFLFHDTIRANLLLARPEASEEELWEALAAASADFVAALPEGLDTVLGDRGVRLSGGERQRVVLARALLRRPALLVLDEATSSLDAENEERIKQAIDGLRGRMTILVIAHRLASIRAADAIHVLEGGRVVESGSWRALCGRKDGRFRALAGAQGLLAEPLPAAS